MSADLKLAIVNQALTEAGEDIIAALTGDEFLPQVAITHYEPIVEEEIEAGNWLFAVKTHSPALLTETAAEPLTHQYDLPAETLKLLGVLYNGSELDGLRYAVEGRTVRVSYDTDVTFRILHRPEEELWPQRFRRIIVRRLLATFLRALEQHREARETDDDTTTKTIIARHAEATQSRNFSGQDGSIVERRRGLIGRR